MPSYRRNIATTSQQCIRASYVPIQAGIVERPIALVVSGAVSVVWHDAFYDFELYRASDTNPMIYRGHLYGGTAAQIAA